MTRELPRIEVTGAASAERARRAPRGPGLIRRPHGRHLDGPDETVRALFLGHARGTRWPRARLYRAPVTIGGHRYIDGGMRSPANADPAAGCDRVLAPVPRGGGPLPGVARQAADLGVPTVVVSPDRATRKFIGAGVGNMLDPARRAAAARAGRAKAATEAAAVAAVWNDRRDGSAHPERSDLHRGR
jgi:hypothetical protein